MSAQAGFTTTDAPRITTHAREQWRKRGDPSIPVEQAWREARPRPCGLLNARFERVHAPTGCTLIACRIHPGRQAQVVLRTVLRPEMDVSRPGRVPNLVPDGGDSDGA